MRLLGKIYVPRTILVQHLTDHVVYDLLLHSVIFRMITNPGEYNSVFGRCFVFRRISCFPSRVRHRLNIGNVFKPVFPGLVWLFVVGWSFLHLPVLSMRDKNLIVLGIRIFYRRQRVPPKAPLLRVSRIVLHSERDERKEQDTCVFHRENSAPKYILKLCLSGRSSLREGKTAITFAR